MNVGRKLFTQRMCILEDSALLDYPFTISDRSLLNASGHYIAIVELYSTTVLLIIIMYSGYKINNCHVIILDL